ncbi:hypothetical protein [Candidatus Poriferisocius sp.]|uniref:hypothetical protein n=1 Tax=Candidatus Poriferisocius sp. TaxID=3101276 RepID=UPI003B596662
MNGHVYRVVLRSQISIGRVVALAVLCAVAILAGFLSRLADDPVVVSTQTMAYFGILIFAPLLALTVGSAALGNLVEDRTLVYLWLRPVSRASMATATMAAVLTVTLPLVVVMMSASATITGVDGLVVATAATTALAAFAYSGLFVALGLRFKQSLFVGLGYVATWEWLLSNLGDSFARLSVRSYPMSLLADATGVSLHLADRSTVAAYVVPLAVGLAGVAYTAWRLQHTEID